MRHCLLVLSLIAAVLPLPTRAGAQQLRLWLDASDLSTLDLNGNVVNRWRDKSGLGNDLVRIQNTPLLTGNGVELVERTNGQTDRLEGSATLAAPQEAFVIFLVCRVYPEAVRVFSTSGNVMSLLREMDFPNDRLQFQTNNSCALFMTPTGTNQTQVYALRRIPAAGGGAENTMWRFGFDRVTGHVGCAPMNISSLRFDNGSGSFPTNPQKGMIVFEVVAFAAPATFATAAVDSPLSDAFVEGELQDLAERWGVGPTPVEPTTWGRIKLLGR